MTMTRAERSRQALALRNRGMLIIDIATRMSISPSYAGELLNDPDGSKARARKDSYRRPCPECGASMNGSNGRGSAAPQRCGECTPPPTEMIWTKEAVIKAIRYFAAKYGHAPVARDWNPALARAGYRDDIAERFYEDACWPCTTQVLARFGTWNAAIAAAGFTPVAPGHYRVNDRRHPIQKEHA